ncbi:MAG: MerR family transcriptional regulator [Caldilinea sp. CFX5]|nr:MerR family transcriptional regulator [Caldilinea sp. CFX5]
MMKASPDTPTFNLKAVVQETGLKPDTLRAWERRYGLPVPQRTDSGHRLYSQKDIQLLKWLIARQDEGMSISRAVELWRRLEAEESDPLETMPAPNAIPTTPVAFNGQSSALLSSAALAGELPAPATADTIHQMRAAWVAACMNFDEQQAERIIAQAFGLFSVERICLDLLQKGLSVIGEGWYAGHVTVQQEHFASALALRRLEALMATTPPPTRPGRILVGCPPEEGHTFAPLLLSLLLRRRGWDILFLGANIPIQDFVQTTQTARPHLVILTAQQLYTAASLREVGDLIYQVRVPMAFGGLVFTQLPDLPQAITGHYLGVNLEGALQRVDELLSPPRLPTPAAPITAEYEEALQYFRLQQATIEAQLWHSLAASGMTHALLHKANINFSRDIIAALTLGNIDYLGADLAWVQGLLTNHYQLPPLMVSRYLTAYLQAAEMHLHDHAAMLINWLRRVLTLERSPLI